VPPASCAAGLRCRVPLYGRQAPGLRAAPGGRRPRPGVRSRCRSGWGGVIEPLASSVSTNAKGSSDLVPRPSPARCRVHLADATRARGHGRRRWRRRDAQPGPLPLLHATGSVALEARRCGGPLGTRCRAEGELGVGVWLRKGPRLLAGSHAPDERQTDGLAAPVGVRFAVEELVTVAGPFAVEHRTATRGRAPAHGGPVLRAAVPAVPGCCHGRR
jgi:hypothetical protein